MQYLAEIIQTSPLTIHFSFHNPEDNDGPAYVPKLLRPLGYFVSLEMKEGQKTLYRTHQPKVKLKLHPDRAESYYALEPGYTYGVVLQAEEFKASPGDYQLDISYSNQQFKGFPGHPLGEMTFQTTLPVHID